MVYTSEKSFKSRYLIRSDDLKPDRPEGQKLYALFSLLHCVFSLMEE
jgi:hypothetical protein